MLTRWRSAIPFAFILVLLSVSHFPFLHCGISKCQGAETITLVAESDAYVAQISPAENFGSTESLQVSSRLNQNERALIRFDLSTIPPGADILQAHLSLYVTQSSSTERIYECHRVSTSWEENTVSWDTKPETISRFLGETKIETSPSWVTWDVTEHVRKMLTGIEEHAWENHGWMIKDKTEDSEAPATSTFISRESPDGERRPYLSFSFNPPKLNLTSDVTTAIAGDWVRLTVKRISQDGVVIIVGDRVVKQDWIDVGSLTVKLSSNSPTGKFSLTVDGDPIDELLIPEGATQVSFFYVGNTVGSHVITVNADDYPQGYYEGDSRTVMVIQDSAPPEISNLVRKPGSPAMGEAVTVSASVSDSGSGVKTAELHYSTDGGATWTDIEMVSRGDAYEAQIPSQNVFSEVLYFVEASDFVGNTAETPMEQFTVGIPIWLYAVTAVVVIVIALVVARTVRRSRTP